MVERPCEALPAEDVSAPEGGRLEEHLAAERAVNLGPDAVQPGLVQDACTAGLGSLVVAWHWDENWLLSLSGQACHK